MFRLLLIHCAGLMVLPQAPAANSTIYSTFPYSTVVPISAMTFKPVGLIPLRVAADTLVLSADGRTFYSKESSVCNRCCDRKTAPCLPDQKPDLVSVPPGRVPQPVPDLREHLLVLHRRRHLRRRQCRGARRGVGAGSGRYFDGFRPGVPDRRRPERRRSLRRPLRQLPL